MEWNYVHSSGIFLGRWSDSVPGRLERDVGSGLPVYYDYRHEKM